MLPLEIQSLSVTAVVGLVRTNYPTCYNKDLTGFHPCFQTVLKEDNDSSQHNQVLYVSQSSPLGGIDVVSQTCIQQTAPMHLAFQFQLEKSIFYCYCRPLVHWAFACLWSHPSSLRHLSHWTPLYNIMQDKGVTIYVIPLSWFFDCSWYHYSQTSTEEWEVEVIILPSPNHVASVPFTCSQCLLL